MITFIIKICNYGLPMLCLANVIVATNVGEQIAWGIATLGWVAHLLEVRKHGN